MKRSMRAFAVYLTALLLLDGTAQALAQYGGGAPGGQWRRGRMESGSGERAGMRERQNIPELVAFRLSLLEEDLKLAPEQEPQWRAFEEKTRALAEDIQRERQRVQSATPRPATQQADHAVDVARDRLTAWKDVAAAATALYDALALAQRTIIDERFASPVAALSERGAPGGRAFGARGSP